MQIQNMARVHSVGRLSPSRSKLASPLMTGITGFAAYESRAALRVIGAASRRPWGVWSMSKSSRAGSSIACRAV